MPPKPSAKRKTVEGLQVGRRGDALETVRTRSGVLNLLVGGNLEVVEGTLASGERITLLPASSMDGDVVEIYYILSGQLIQHEQSGREPLGPGDYIVTRGLREEAIFTAAGEVRFLYLTSQPFFAQISTGLQELMRLAVEVELKDGYTAEHCLRLQKLSFETGKTIGLGANRLHLLDHASYLHDVGKVRVPVEILQKPSALTDEEWVIIRRHPTFGREMLESTFIRDAGPIVEQHHERMDGSGYPFGLVGDEILTEAYIVAIVDTFDAMTTDRAYRKALPTSTAIEVLRENAGVHYPAELVSAFISTVEVEERQ